MPPDDRQRALGADPGGHDEPNGGRRREADATEGRRGPTAGAHLPPDPLRELIGPRPNAFLRRAALLLPPLLIVIGVIAQSLTPPDIVFSAVFAAAPLVAAPLYSPRATAVTGLVAVVTLVWLMHLMDGVTLFEGALKAATVTTVSLLALVLNRVVRRGAQRLATARDIAEAAQLALLPPPEQWLGHLEIAARYQAAHQEASIGGDLYAVQDTPHGVRLLVGDVRGKGLEAVGAVVIVLGAFREAAEEEADLAVVALRLDRALRREGGRRTDTVDSFEGFTTAVLAEITPAGRLRVVNCGHPAPWLLLPGGRLESLDPAGYALPLGLAALPGEAAEKPPVDEVAFPVGATLLMNTDGLTEARGRDGLFYEPALRIKEEWARYGPEALLDEIVADVAEYTGGPPADDLALLAVTHRDRADRL
ncbi:PP2C family protein-serine/threonine phosphatase [Streptomyces sp. JJ38]|uniref:PP2C family protein-serine/threonine phosphatase n=1 Tax=Streptomyces sp. JJ38 TaxID=2738128 RepID=UPI001C596F10|nr:PP2C family protein-serine/threonine phosphatase [Streptomyces sp. JJ38]MBW1599987.1 serine/threonine-protein phosphatase [Streptomyces sp. JJ38]